MQFNSKLQFSDLPSDLILKFKRAGMRNRHRSYTEAQAFFEESIPDNIKLLGEKGLRQFLNGKDASHVKSRVNGGSGSPKNMVWEASQVNRARGSQNMTAREQARVKCSNGTAFLGQRGFYKKVGANAARGAVKGAVAAGGVSAVKNIWNVWDGDITSKEAAVNIATDCGRGALAGGGSAAVLTAVGFACPPAISVIRAVGSVSPPPATPNVLADLGSFATEKLTRQSRMRGFVQAQSPEGASGGWVAEFARLSHL